MLANNKLKNIEKNYDLHAPVIKDTGVKDWLVDYVGQHFQGELARATAEKGEKIEWNGDVTVEMIVELMAKEFPEFVMALAEENFIRGYQQAFDDIEFGKKMVAEEQAAELGPEND